MAGLFFGKSHLEVGDARGWPYDSGNPSILLLTKILWFPAPLRSLCSRCSLVSGESLHTLLCVKKGAVEMGGFGHELEVAAVLCDMFGRDI